MVRGLKERKMQWLAIGGTVFLLVFALLGFCLLHKNVDFNKGLPTLIVETPQKLSASETDTFVLDVLISSLGDALYPAASMSISFDSARLEFLGVEEGNVLIRNEGEDSSIQQTLPSWSYNTAVCNESGQINVMYLDLTGGKNAFCKELLAEEDNVVLRLKFRLRGSVRAGDVYDLIIEDAVFAASEESQSLAMMADTLKVKNGKIVIGD